MRVTQVQGGRVEAGKYGVRFIPMEATSAMSHAGVRFPEFVVRSDGGVETTIVHYPVARTEIKGKPVIIGVDETAVMLICR